MRRTRLLAIALWAPLAAGPPALGQQVQPASTTADATRAAADRARRLAEFVQAVRDADHPRQAITAYARGCAVDASRPEIHEAQMRRMLRFGLPKIALFPARSLVAIQPDNGLAWGVLGYVHGQRGELAEAFAASIRAAEHARDNPSILHNAGQLVAWYDHELELPKLPDRAKRSLSRIRDDLLKLQPFADAYRQITSVYKDQAAEAGQFARQIDAAEAEALALEQLALDIDRKMRDLHDEIGYHEEIIHSLRRDLYYTTWVYQRDIYGRRVYWPAYDGPYRRETNRRIREHERKIERLQLDIGVLRREGHGVLRDLRAKRRQLDQLREKMKLVWEKVERRFRWDPPAVDGVVTDEMEHFPAAKAEPDTPESAARKQLEMAELYLRHGLRDRAVEILQQLLSGYGSTQAADRARSLLGKLKAPG